MRYIDSSEWYEGYREHVYVSALPAQPTEALVRIASQLIPSPTLRTKEADKPQCIYR